MNAEQQNQIVAMMHKLMVARGVESKDLNLEVVTGLFREVTDGIAKTYISVIDRVVSCKEVRTALANDIWEAVNA